MDCVVHVNKTLGHCDMGRVGSGQVRSGRVRSGQVGSGRVRLGQVGLNSFSDIDRK